MTDMYIVAIVFGGLFLILGPIAVIFAKPISRSFRRQGRVTIRRTGERFYPTWLFYVIGVVAFFLGIFLVVNNALLLAHA